MAGSLAMGRAKILEGTLGNIKIVETKAGNHQASAYTTDASGKRKRIRFTGATKSAAKLGLQAKALEIREDTLPFGGETPTVAHAIRDFLADLNVAEAEEAVDGSVRPQTADQYHRHGGYAIHLLGGIELKKLTPGKMQSQLKSLIDTKAQTGHTTARLTHAVLRMALDRAVRLEVLTLNPAKGVRLPKKPKRGPVAPSPETLQRFRELLHEWTYAKGRSGPNPSVHYLHITELMLGTGLRIGEACVLRWCDIDFDRGLVEITGTYNERGTRRHQHEPKTRSSRRTLHLPEGVLTTLQERYTQLQRPEPHEYLFATRNGTPLAPTAIRTAYRKALNYAHAKLETPIHPHGFRKAVATAITDLAGLEAAAEQLGHSDTRTTANFYSMRPLVKKNQTAALDKLVGPTSTTSS